jgi:hypothetical protein
MKAETESFNKLDIPDGMTIEEFAMKMAVDSIKMQMEIAEMIAKDKRFYEEMDPKEKKAFIQNVTALSKATGDMIAQIIKYATETKNIFLKQEAMRLLTVNAQTNKKRIATPLRACQYELTQ